jgi:hypothetical protein
MSSTLIINRNNEPVFSPAQHSPKSTQSADRCSQETIALTTL